MSRMKVGSRARQCVVERITSIRAYQSQSQSQFQILNCSSLYEVLSVPHNVSARDVKSAYRRMALRYHPDVCPPAEKEKCTRLFLKVQEAYELCRTLSSVTITIADCKTDWNSATVWEAQRVASICGKFS
ncbi:hypothetical protein SUGI_0532060 [Cryptomeria japonica]|nr:hypothetical protein SUGI_0532060 [Cryptomeria japonica]